ncbi:hypothetical protein EV13_2340 [Prochlorococcus sp. MIT 0702]|nr:hypothetical protein EV12_1940 [Prochlorococcus sp. MIT 0701]KGG26879.1 hypothetical protein EV13_2340 [Prochlorococcus sp. MIT 0702]KGG36155.1 hypothetical protein EV14_0564 [Prochlorococcus sp. MIT 0703]
MSYIGGSHRHAWRQSAFAADGPWRNSARKIHLLEAIRRAHKLKRRRRI